MGKRKTAKMIWLILVIASILRLVSLNQSLWLDEAINVLATQKFSLLGMITEYAKADFHPPGFFILIWLWTRLLGISEIAIRIPSVIFGLVTIYFIFLTGTKLHSKRLGLLCALLLSINPLHIYYSQEARMYSLAAMAVTINIFLFIKLINKEKLSIIFLILSNLLVLSSDYVAYFIFPSLFLVLLILKQKDILKKWLLSFFIALCLGVWWIPIFFSQLDVGAVVSSKLPAWRFIVGGFDFKAVPLTFVKFIIGRISYPDKVIYGLILLPAGIMYALLLWRGVKFMKGVERNLILIWILVPLIFATVVSFFIPIYSYFRLLFVLAAFIILISAGIFSFKSKIRYGFLAAVLSVQLFSASVYLFNPAYQRDDWRGVVNFLRTQGGIPVLFESSGTLPPFDYYSKGEIKAIGALSDFPAKNMADVADLSKLLAGESEVYLVEFLVDISDPGRLVQKRLNELNYKEIEIKNFNGVGFVYHYEK